MNKPFLQQVAEYYINNDIDLSQYTMVLPNKRSGKFLRMYLREAIEANERVAFLPRIVTITDFIQQYCDKPLGDETELIFILYKAYCRVLKRHNQREADFDSFAFWGKMLLNDFNDVDAYLVDEKQLFKNLRDERSIQSSYLTEEQKQVLEGLLGIHIDMDSETFWKHIKNEAADDASKEKYLAFWEIMDELYMDFNQMLESMETPITYTGRQSKEAWERLRQLDTHDMRGQRFAFIGFSVLSTSRALIFRHLKDIKVADFFWDTASPYVQAPDSSAGRFVMPLSRKLPQPEGFRLLPIEGKTKIDIISVPSNVGQTKAAVAMLDAWRPASDSDGGAEHQGDQPLIKTGMVLPNPGLLIPMLYTLPERYQPLNVTMGFPYSMTPFASLLDSIFKMARRARREHHETYFMATDIDEVLSHPNIMTLSSQTVAAIKTLIVSSHLFFVGSSELMLECQKVYQQQMASREAALALDPTAELPEPVNLDFLFQPIGEDVSYGQGKDYLNNLLTYLRTETLKYAERVRGDKAAKAYEIVMLDAYGEAIDKIERLAFRHNISMGDKSFFSLVRKALSLQEIPFAGDPVKGMQIMGFMDSRLLDFDQMVILSANERILPRRSVKPSLILASLRYGYGLPTQDDEESSSAYNFYRTISRGSHVALIYDGRVGGANSGEMSRYLSQLLFMPKDGVDITMRTVELNPEALGPRTIQIDKTDEVVKELARFQPGGDLNISASALKTYLLCPLRFYLEFVKRLKLENPALEYMDATYYGSVLHGTAERLYRNNADDPERNCERYIDHKALDEMLSRDIKAITLQEMDKRYYHRRYEGNLDKIPGEGQILAEVIEKYIRKMIELEKKKPAYTFVAAEDNGGQKIHHWQVTPHHAINFKMSIDRLDRLDDGRLRFVDYKTGSDEIKAPSIPDLFANHSYGGIFQVLTYCLAYSKIKNYNGAIQPMIYGFPKMAKNGIPNLEIAKKEITDFNDVRNEFEPLFYELIDKILETENKYPFCQTDNRDNCDNCPFVHMCGRFKPKSK